MAIVRPATKKPESAGQRAQRRHKGDRAHPLTDLTPAQRHHAQGCYEFERKQNRSWLGAQMTQPNSNGISRSHHAELFQYFKAPTLNERVAQLSTEAKEHLARLDNERKAAKEAQGLAPTMDTRVAHWWVQEPKVVAPKPKKKENRKARKIREFLERKDREREEGEARAQVTEGMSRMDIGEGHGDEDETMIDE